MTTEVMTTEAPGNTKAVASFRGRAFQFTLNEPYKYRLLKEKLVDLKTLDYLLSCEEEAPTTGHKHIHIYAHFSQPYKLSKKILEIGSHIEICRGSPKQNIEYIRKDGNILDEIGQPPSQGCRTVSDLKEMSIDECPPQYYRIKNEIDEKKKEEDEFMSMLDEIDHDELKAPEIIYITGDPGKGKTYKAYKTALEKYEKADIGKIQINNNFCKFTNDKAKCFVIEEFRPSQMHAAEFLQMIDKYGYNANIKGGFKSIRPECLIICSVLKPSEIYNTEINKQFTRRITKVIDLGHEANILDDL